MITLYGDLVLKPHEEPPVSQSITGFTAEQAWHD